MAQDRFMLAQPQKTLNGPQRCPRPKMEPKWLQAGSNWICFSFVVVFSRIDLAIPLSRSSSLFRQIPFPLPVPFPLPIPLSPSSSPFPFQFPFPLPVSLSPSKSPFPFQFPFPLPVSLFLSNSFPFPLPVPLPPCSSRGATGAPCWLTLAPVGVMSA